MRQIFQLKAKPHGIDRFALFIEKGFISIGYPELANLKNMDITQIEEALMQNYPDYRGQSLAFHKGMVNAFVNSMQEDDIVLVANGNDVYVGVVGAYEYRTDYALTEGLCHQRTVNWVAKTERPFLNDKVQEHLKNRATITKFKYHFEDAELQPYLEGDFDAKIAAQSKVDVQNKAWQILVDALDSENEQIRVIAAAAIWQG